MYLSPGHPIIAIGNNRNQNGRRIGKKVYWTAIIIQVKNKRMRPLRLSLQTAEQKFDLIFIFQRLGWQSDKHENLPQSVFL